VTTANNASDINYTLLGELAAKPHPLLNIADGDEYLLRVDGKLDDCCGSIGEVMQEARTAHHLLDLAGIPHGTGYARDLDARTWQLVVKTQDLGERLARIADWHARETGPAGTVGDFCVECGTRWPCDTRKMADGTYRDEED
jgi:hypothetical protein